MARKPRGELAALGASVSLIDLDGSAAASVVTVIECAGGQAIGIEADVTDVDAIAAASVTVLHHFGPCEVLVNNAALVGYVGALVDSDIEQWNRMLSVNLTGPLICTRTFATQMMDTGTGSIINVTSICGHLPLPSGGAYNVTKSGLMMLTRMLALELAQHGIRCNSVSPGLVRTPATEVAYSEFDSAEARKRMVPSGRIADPVDLANDIAFLSSDRAGYINGQDILVDGALSQTLMRLVRRPAKPMRAS